jgi:hypothetical protein
MKKNVIYLEEKRKKMPPVVIDGDDIRNYIYSRIDFHLPESTYVIIDDIFADLWNNIPSSGRFDFFDIVDALYGLYDYGILLGDNHIHEIAMYVVEALEQMGHLTKLSANQNF